MKLYGDEIYRRIVDPIKDPQLLQMDLSNLMEWARNRGTQREYSSKPLKHSTVKRILVFKR